MLWSDKAIWWELSIWNKTVTTQTEHHTGLVFSVAFLVSKPKMVTGIAGWWLQPPSSPVLAGSFLRSIFCWAPGPRLHWKRELPPKVNLDWTDMFFWLNEITFYQPHKKMKYMCSFAIWGAFLMCVQELCQLLTGDPFPTPFPKSIANTNMLCLNKASDSKITCWSLKRP